MQEQLSDFDIQWCQDIINSPDFEQLNHPSRRPPPPLDKFITNTLFTETLRTERTIRAWLVLQSRLKKPNAASNEFILLLSLGDGLDGHRGIAHGGFSALVMDQIVNMCASLTFGPCVTAESWQKFKRSIPLPGIVACRAVCTRVDDRRIHVESTLDDGLGMVYCEGGTVCMRRRQSTKANM